MIAKKGKRKQTGGRMHSAPYHKQTDTRKKTGIRKRGKQTTSNDDDEILVRIKNEFYRPDAKPKFHKRQQPYRQVFSPRQSVRMPHKR